MITVGACVLLGIAVGSSIASRTGALRWRSLILALPAAVVVTVAMFLVPLLGGWVFVLLAVAAVWAAIVIVRAHEITDAVDVFMVVLRILLLAAALTVAGLCRLGLEGDIPDEWIGAAVTGLGGATAVIVGLDFADSPGLSHVEYGDAEQNELQAAREVQGIIWWKIISAGVIFIAILLIEVAPQAEESNLSRPIVALSLAIGAIAASAWGLTRVRRLSNHAPGSHLRFGEFGPLVIANVFAIALTFNALRGSTLPPANDRITLLLAILVLVWFVAELTANAALNGVPITAAARFGFAICAATPAAAFLTLATPSAAPIVPTPLDTLLVVTVGALVSVGTFTGIGRLVFRWPSRTLQPTFVALLVDSLMYWWVVVAAGLVVSLGIAVREDWGVTLLITVGSGIVVVVILFNDVHHYSDQAKRTRDPGRWAFGENVGRDFRRVLAAHLAVQWTTGLLIVGASALSALGLLGAAQLLSG